MVRISMESIFPASRTELWRVLELHFDNDVIRKIHPFMLTSKRTSTDEKVREFERTWRIAGRTFSVTTRYDTVPMGMFRSEITASTGGIAPGSYIENKYSERAEGTTKIVTNGELTLKGVPGFMQGWIVRRSLGQVDDEDLRYLLSTRA